MTVREMSDSVVRPASQPEERQLAETSLLFVRLGTVLAGVPGFVLGLAAPVVGDRQVGLFALSLLLVGGLGGWQLRRRRPAPLVLSVALVTAFGAFVPFLEPVVAVAVLIGLVGFGTMAAVVIPSGLRVYYLAYLGALVAIGLVVTEAGSTVDRLLAVVVLAAAFVGGGALCSSITSKVAGSEERYRKLFESAGDAIVTVDGEQRIVLFNRQAGRMFGYDVNYAIGRPLTMLLPSKERQAHPAHVRHFAGGEEDRLMMYDRHGRSALRSDGEEFPVEVTISKQSVNGQFEFTAVVRDMSDRVEARQALEEMLESKNELIASISHELRTPLTAVLGFAQVLQDPASGLSTEDRDEMRRSIVDEGTDLANIVDDLLVVAKAEAGILSVSHVAVDLQSQVAQVTEGEHHGFTGKIEVCDDVVHALGDPARIRQICRNLISNAVRYGGDNIQVELGGNGATARLAVIDDGPGVPPEDQDRIFEPYSQANQVPGTTASLGLGLSLSRDLARLMDGDLVYRRKADETIFELLLPRSD